ncbi:HEAT repeat domain-containing protein [Almyronema epifaneia]|uniref:HEAT repeat domain-containing protein n=1 Tax=Almyronema epifaneia S1 TaxID=2991925 RepID=A0ABW6IFW5_9CYAN
MQQSLTQSEQSTCLSPVAAAIAALETGDFQSRWEITKHIRELGTEAVPALIELVQDKTLDWEIRWFAARLLGEFDQPAVVIALARLLATSDDEALCEIAAEALAQIGSSAITVLAQSLAEASQRPFAVYALARIRTSATIDPLLSVTTDADATIRTQAVEALSSFRDPRIPPVLVQALSDPAAAVRTEAIATLGRRKDLVESLNLVEHLQTRLWDLNPTVCAQAAIALGRLGTPAAAAALGRVLRLAHTPAALQLEIVRALSWILTEPVIQTLIAAFEKVPEAVQQETLRALAKVKQPALQATVVNTLLTWLHQPDLSDPNRQTLIMALANLGDRRSLDSLILQLAHPQKRIYLHAIAALKQLAADQAQQRLSQKLQQPTLSPELKQALQKALQEW